MCDRQFLRFHACVIDFMKGLVTANITPPESDELTYNRAHVYQKASTALSSLALRPLTLQVCLVARQSLYGLKLLKNWLIACSLTCL